MADPVIKPAVETPMGAFDPFAQSMASKYKEESKRVLEENQVKRKALEQQLAQAGVTPGHPAWNSENPIVAQMEAIDRATQWHQTRAQGIDPNTGKGLAPEWANLIDPATGKLRDNFQLSQYDPSQFKAYQQFQNEATRAPGTQSAWANIQLQAQGAEQAAARDQAAKQAMAGTSQAMGQLAMRGGAGSGSRTALARDMQRQLLSQNQNTARQGMMQRFDIAKQDENQRQQQLGQAVGFEKNIAAAQKDVEGRNLANLMNEISGRRSFEQEQYLGKMREYGAKQEADAAANAGGGK